jgi:hypothetical protein
MPWELTAKVGVPDSCLSRGEVPRNFRSCHVYFPNWSTDIFKIQHSIFLSWISGFPMLISKSGVSGRECSRSHNEIIVTLDLFWECSLQARGLQIYMYIYIEIQLFKVVGESALHLIPPQSSSMGERGQCHSISLPSGLNSTCAWLPKGSLHSHRWHCTCFTPLTLGYQAFKSI